MTIDLTAIGKAFPELADIKPLPIPQSGQKEVLSARWNGRSVVLKLIKPDIADARVRREIEAVAKLKSCYVPTIFEHGERDIGSIKQLYLIEEFISGETLRVRLARDGVWPINEVLRIAQILLSACCDFEKSRLVHRDMKPENIMVDSNGQFWIIDFGIVRDLDLMSLTPTADKFGPFTAGYAAPEQMRNLKTDINTRADLFSVGVILYEIATGVNPYRFGKRSILDVINHVTGIDLPPAAIPGDKDQKLSEFISSLTARFPSRRPQSATEALCWFKPVQAAYISANTPQL